MAPLESSDARQSHSLGFKLRSAREGNSNKHRSSSRVCLSLPWYCSLSAFWIIQARTAALGMRGSPELTASHTFASADRVVCLPSGLRVHGGDPMARNATKSRVTHHPFASDRRRVSRKRPLADALCGAQPAPAQIHVLPIGFCSYTYDRVLGLGCRIFKWLAVRTVEALF
jgi:hypothetical protein